MNLDLSPIEARIIGVLIEKAVTTPDNYPLSLNSLTLACNQKSNRDPVLELTEAQVLDVVESLIERRLVSEDGTMSSRVKKYQHRFCNSEFGDLQFNEQELAVICCLLLRGPQTPGELRTRTNRLCTFADVRETERVLDALVDKGWVQKLAREAGKRESRYIQLFSNPKEHLADTAIASVSNRNEDSRLSTLEQEVQILRAEVEVLRKKIDG